MLLVAAQDEQQRMCVLGVYTDACKMFGEPSPVSQPFPPPISSPGWSSRTKRNVLLAVVALVLLAVWRLNEALPLVIISLVLSYLFYPITTFIENRLKRFLPSARNWAIFFTIVGFISLLIIFFIVVFPALFTQLEEFGNRLPGLVASLQANAEAWLSQPVIINGQPVMIDGRELIPLEQIRQLGSNSDANLPVQLSNFNIVEAARTFINSLTGPAVNVVGGALTFIINAIFLLTLIFYWLKDGGRFINTIIGFAPITYRNDASRLFFELGRVWDAYLRGQLFLSTFVGVVVFICATLLGVPNAPTLGLISGVMEFIPTLGPLIAIIPAILLALGSQSSTLPFLEGLPFAIVVIAVWITIQNIQAMIVSPRVMGTRLNLHPVVILMGVIAGANLAGAFGIILAAPTIATLRMVGQYIYGKLTDTNPFPNPPNNRKGEPSPIPPLLSKAYAYFQRFAEPKLRRLHTRLTGKAIAE
jgi:predicted PurR-regulated permease PerM